jgi:hypothetical protein
MRLDVINENTTVPLPRTENLIVMQVNLHKLTCKSKPSTAPIGTMRVIAALRCLAKRHCVSFRAWKLVARTQAEMLVSATDSAADIERQWVRLTNHLQAPDTAMIYHLENHYSVIYAAREWQTVCNVRDGVQGENSVRQILVGKPGQAPSKWIDWEDVRACLLGWKGYGIVGVQRGADKETNDHV